MTLNAFDTAPIFNFLAVVAESSTAGHIDVALSRPATSLPLLGFSIQLLTLYSSLIETCFWRIPITWTAGEFPKQEYCRHGHIILGKFWRPFHALAKKTCWQIPLSAQTKSGWQGHFSLAQDQITGKLRTDHMGRRCFFSFVEELWLACNTGGPIDLHRELLPFLPSVDEMLVTG